MVFPTNTYTCSIIQKHVHEFHSVIKFRSHHYNKLCVEECILVDLLFYYCLVPSVKQRRPFSSKCSLTGIFWSFWSIPVHIYFRILGMLYVYVWFFLWKKILLGPMLTCLLHLPLIPFLQCKKIHSSRIGIWRIHSFKIILKRSNNLLFKHFPIWSKVSLMIAVNNKIHVSALHFSK